MRFWYHICLLLLSSTTSILALPSQLSVAYSNSKPIRHRRSVDFAFGRDPVRGLNIGGWLVLEAWITPSIFESLDQSLGIVDEYTLTQKLGTTAALEILRPHWDTWCTFYDFQKIANAGFNTVRIPVGYWAYESYANETYTSGSAVYIDAAIDWARAVGLKVWIDLHGAPGSQNGYDNSGHKRPSPGWGTGDTVKATLDVLQTIASKYAKPEYSDVVVGIQLLNEPASYFPNFNLTVLEQFYQDGYDIVRNVGDTVVVLHDAFRKPKQWNGFLSPNTSQNVLVDHHDYQVFDNYLVTLSDSQHRQLVCNDTANYGGADKWVVVGEWSGAETDCAKYLNGYGIGARYDGTYSNTSTYTANCSIYQHDLSRWNASLKDNVRGYIEAQMDAFERAANGWIFWNFKTENSSAPEWDAFALLDAGLFPQPLTDRKFGSNCTYTIPRR